MSRKYDVVVYGASGYTGRWIVEELLASRSTETVAVAGRSASRLRQTLSHHSPRLTQLIATYCKEHGLDFLPILECDSGDAASLEAMAESARVVIAAAGPFNIVGMPVVDACVKFGAHYVDISGEPLFVERVYVAHNGEAKKRGVTIVNCCGFDCIPSDIAINEIRRHVPNVARIEGFLSSNAHGNTGTLFTAVDGIRSSGALAQLRRNSPRPKLSLASSFKPRTLFRHPQAGYCLLFPGADPTIVRNSQVERKERFGVEPVEIGLYFSTKSLLVLVVVMWIGLVIFLASRIRAFEALLRRAPRLFTFGLFAEEPDPASLKHKTAKWTFVFSTSDHKRGEATIKMGDPGYGATSVCVVACALTLARSAAPVSPRSRRKALSSSGSKVPAGVVTSATAFAETDLVARLQERGVAFDLTFPK